MKWKKHQKQISENAFNAENKMLFWKKKKKKKKNTSFGRFYLHRNLSHKSCNEHHQLGS